MIQTNHIGSVSESAVTLDLLQRGYNVLMPAVISRYDLLLELGDSYLKIQVKTARTDRRDGNLRVTWERPYSPNEVDIIAVYDPETTNIYYIPLEDISPGSKGLTIRVKQYKYKKSTGFIAEDYLDFPEKYLCEVAI